MSYSELVASKPKNSYPESALQEFALVSIDKESSMPIGSYSYRIQKYEADYDSLEEFISCCSKKEVVNEFVVGIQKTVENILTKPNHFFMELKAGLDERFNNPNVRNLLRENLITEEEYNDIFEDPDLMDEILRDHLILRWSADEIALGVKNLPGGGAITLQQAVSQKSKVNLEIISYVNGRFINVSNFFILIEITPNNEIKVINLPQEIYDDFDNYFITTLKQAIQELQEDGEWFKAIKRMWSLARYEKDYDTIGLLKDIITSDVSALNQIAADLSTLIKIFLKVPEPPIDLIAKEIDNMKNRIATNSLIENKQLDIWNKLIDVTVNDLINGQLQMALESIDFIEGKFKSIVNHEAEEFLSLHQHEYFGGFDWFYPLKKGYQFLDNIYRKNSCDGKSRDLEYGEIHPLCANFEGPGTRLDLPEVRNYPPYNDVDACAKTHDLEYEQIFIIDNENEREGKIRQADNKFLNCIEPYKNEEPYYSIGKLGIQGKMSAEELIPTLTKAISGNYFGTK